jgi:low temperature requirement protein LtrA
MTPMPTVKHGLRAWFGQGPRRHGEPVIGRTVSYIELFYDLVYVVLVGQAAHALAEHPGWSAAAIFAAVFGLIWIAWVNGTLYHELHGREDGRSRLYIFAQMCVLAVLAVFTGSAGGDGGTPFALTYVVLLVLLTWQWYEVRRRDLPENKYASTPYIIGLLLTIAIMTATAWLPPAARISSWALVVVGWVGLGTHSFVTRGAYERFVQPSESLVERLALFVIIVLGETGVGVVNGINELGRTPIAIATGVVALCIGFGLWWNYFDIVGVRELRPDGRALAVWFMGHLVLTGSIAATGAAMVGLVGHASDSHTPTAVAWTLGVAVALVLVLVVAQSAAVERGSDELPARSLALVFGVGALLVLALAWWAPAPWLLALLVVGVLSATWLSTFVPRQDA